MLSNKLKETYCSYIIVLLILKVHQTNSINPCNPSIPDIYTISGRALPLIYPLPPDRVIKLCPISTNSYLLLYIEHIIL